MPKLKQNTFTIIPNAPAFRAIPPAGPVSKPPMTSKQARKLYNQKNREPRRSKAEQRLWERQEQERIRKELEKEQAATKARAARERKKAKEQVALEEKKKKRIPLVKVRPSQDTISRFVRGFCRPVKRDRASTTEEAESAVKADADAEDRASDRESCSPGPGKRQRLDNIDQTHEAAEITVAEEPKCAQPQACVPVSPPAATVSQRREEGSTRGSIVEEGSLRGQQVVHSDTTRANPSSIPARAPIRASTRPVDASPTTNSAQKPTATPREHLTNQESRLPGSIVAKERSPNHRGSETSQRHPPIPTCSSSTAETSGSASPSPGLSVAAGPQSTRKPGQDMIPTILIADLPGVPAPPVRLPAAPSLGPAGHPTRPTGRESGQAVLGISPQVVNAVAVAAPSSAAGVMGVSATGGKATLTTKLPNLPSTSHTPRFKKQGPFALRQDRSWSGEWRQTYSPISHRQPLPSNRSTTMAPPPLPLTRQLVVSKDRVRDHTRQNQQDHQIPRKPRLSHTFLGHVPPTSTQMFLLDNIDDILPSPSQEARELFGDENKPPFSMAKSSAHPILTRPKLLKQPRRPTKALAAAASDLSPAAKPILPGRLRSDPNDELSFLSTQDVMLSSQDIREVEETPARAKPAKPSTNTTFGSRFLARSSARASKQGGQVQPPPATPTGSDVPSTDSEAPDSEGRARLFTSTCTILQVGPARMESIQTLRAEESARRRPEALLEEKRLAAEQRRIAEEERKKKVEAKAEAKTEATAEVVAEAKVRTKAEAEGARKRAEDQQRAESTELAGLAVIDMDTEDDDEFGTLDDPHIEWAAALDAEPSLVSVPLHDKIPTSLEGCLSATGPHSQPGALSCTQETDYGDLDLGENLDFLDDFFLTAN